MSVVMLQQFRSLLTERFTGVAVEIFGEVESLVEAYRLENKRLHNILQMVLNPEIKLSKIDISEYSVPTTDVKEQPPELETEENPELSEPLPIVPKEEQLESDIIVETEQRQRLGAAEGLIAAECIKEDGMADISDLLHVQVEEEHPRSSSTLSPNDLEISNAVPNLYLSPSGESADSEPQYRKYKRKSKTKSSQSRKKMPKSSLQKTMLELPRTMPFKSFISEPADCQSLLKRVTLAYQDFAEDQKPLIAKTGLKEKVQLVDSAFGKVPVGCPLSYQCPLPSDRDFAVCDDAPPQPSLPLMDHSLGPVTAFPTLGVKERRHVNLLMEMSWETAHALELATREHKGEAEELRKTRLTSRFGEICKLKPGRTHAEHLVIKILKGRTRCKAAQVEEELKAEALRIYCRNMCLNRSSCGFVIHPNAPWLGAQPDGLVYDPKENPSFGLVHVKCTTLSSFAGCKFLICKDGVLRLKKTHTYYWHIQGEMMVTATSWCDLLLFSDEDVLVQRIYRDEDFIGTMKKQLDDFFFYYFLPSSLK